MLATSADVLPVGPDWTYELKLDGYRSLAQKDGARVRLLSRNLKDLSRDFPTAVAAIKTLSTTQLVLDGEIVAVGADGRPSFQALQHRATKNLAIVYFAFDVVELNGNSLIKRPLEERRRQLSAALDGSVVPISEPLPGTVDQIEREVRRLRLEGIVAKRLGSSYRPGQRSDDWIKVKFSPRQEFVVGGYRPEGKAFDSVLVGYYKDRELWFAGKVRAGFTAHQKAELFSRITKHPVKTCPFVNLPNRGGRSRWGEGISAEDMERLRWIQARQVIEVAFVEWTIDGLLRHPRFVGMRDDKPSRAVRREFE